MSGGRHSRSTERWTRGKFEKEGDMEKAGNLACISFYREDDACSLKTHWHVSRKDR
jgi:hypothetical protein